MSHRNGTPVRARSQHEGVGNALRAAFNGRPNNDYGVPEDLQALLSRLG